MSLILRNLNRVLRSRSYLIRSLSRQKIIEKSFSHLQQNKNCNVLTISSIPNYMRFCTIHQLHNTKYEEAKVDKKIIEKLFTHVVSLPFINFDTLYGSVERYANDNKKVSDLLTIMETCSQLVDRSVEEKIKLVELIWDFILQNVSNLPERNQLLGLIQAYRHSGKSIEDCLSFLAQYECTSTPTADVCEELLLLICQNNKSMNQASDLLNYIKENNLPKTEQIYNALIVGYSKNNAIENCSEILNEMSEANVPPSLQTYTELCKAYIQNGDEKKAIDLLNKHNEFTCDQIYDVIRIAALNNYTEIIKNALNLLPDTNKHVKLIIEQLRNICIELVHSSIHSSELQIDPYHLIIKQLPKPIFQNEDTDEYGYFLLREMISAKMPLPKVLQFCDNLITSGRNLRALHVLCGISIFRDQSITNDILKILATKEPLRPHYFWPLLMHASSEPELLEIIKLAVKLGTAIDANTIEEFILEKSPKTLNDSKLAFKILNDAGLQKDNLKTALISFLLGQNRLEEALNIAKVYLSSVDTKYLKEPFLQYLRNPNYRDNVPTVLNLIKSVQDKGVQKLYHLPSDILLDVATYKGEIRNSFILTTQLIDNYAKEKLKISQFTCDGILASMSKTRDIALKYEPILRALVDNEIYSDEFGIPSNHTKSLNEMEEHLAELQAKGLNSRGAIRKLFLMCCKTNNTERALELCKLIEADNFDTSPALLACTIDLMTKTKNVNNAEIAFAKLKSRFPKFHIDSYKIVDLATLLVQNNRLDDSLQLLKTNWKTSLGNNKYISVNVWRFLMEVAEWSIKNKRIENVTEIVLNTLVELGYCNYSNTHLGPVIREHIDKNEIEMAVDAFERLSEKHRKTPQQVVLMSQLIKISNDEQSPINGTKSNELLKRVVTACRKVHGDGSTNTNLLTAFAISGTEQQLRKLLMNPTVKVVSEKMNKNLEHLSNNNKVEIIMKLAKCCRGIRNETIDEQSLYQTLLNGFVRENNWQSAIEFFKEISMDEGSKISQKLLQTLVDLLEKNKQEIPTEIRLKIYSKA